MMRQCIRIVVLLIVGAVINVGVVMACARWGGEGWHYAEPVAVESVPRDVNEYISEPAYMKLWGDDRPTGLEVMTVRTFATTQVMYSRWHDSSWSYVRSFEVTQLGVPFRSMQYAERGYTDMTAHIPFGHERVAGARGGWAIAPPENERSGWLGYRRPPHIYPLMIIPLGFAANTVVYAAMLFAVFFVPGKVRRSIRRRRRQCVRCGYPIGASEVCTECGAAVTTVKL